jgi:hypothetical protein
MADSTKKQHSTDDGSAILRIMVLVALVVGLLVGGRGDVCLHSSWRHT